MLKKEEGKFHIKCLLNDHSVIKANSLRVQDLYRFVFAFRRILELLQILYV